MRRLSEKGAREQAAGDVRARFVHGLLLGGGFSFISRVTNNHDGRVYHKQF